MTNILKTSFNITIVGNGAIGNLLAYQCQKLGLNYQLLLRKKSDLNLQVQDIDGLVHTIHPQVSDITSHLPFDLIILPVKAYQVENALRELTPLISPKHIIILLHNGMGTIEQVRKLLPDNPLIAAATSYGAFKTSTSDSQIQHLNITGLGQTHLGWINPIAKQTKQNIEICLSALLPPSTWHKNINVALWRKLAVNAAINPLTAIHNIKNGQLAKAKFTEQLKHICEEVAQVIHAEGYAIPANNLLNDVQQIIKATANNYSSMHQDIIHNRRTEIDFINGYVCNRASFWGIDTPINQQLINHIQTL